MIRYNFIKPAYAFAEFRIKMVFNAVIGPNLQLKYLPGSFWAIIDHLFPNS
jgi:hypothetical protein